MTTAGSPCLERHAPRSEAEALRDVVLRLARDGLVADPTIDPEALFVRGAALRNIIRILDGGDPPKPQNEAQSQPAKPQKEIV